MGHADIPYGAITHNHGSPLNDRQVAERELAAMERCDHRFIEPEDGTVGGGRCSECGASRAVIARHRSERQAAKARERNR